MIDGKAVAAELREGLKARCAGLAARGITPGLAVILVGDDLASRIYVRNKERACASVGIHTRTFRFPAETEMGALKAQIDVDQKAVDDAAASIEGRVAELQAKSDELAKGISPQVLARYRFIRSRRSGEAIVSASGGTCTGCHMRLQPQAFIVLQRQNSLECCQNCQRIIYYSAEEAAALHHDK